MWKLRDWIKESCLNRQISLNPRATGYLKEHPNLIEWTFLSENPEAIDLLEQNQDKIDWTWLSANPSAMNLLKQNQDKIDWWELSKNPIIFEYDYKNMVRPFKEELIAVCYHPDNYKRLL